MTLFGKGAYLWTAGFGWCLVLYCCNSCRVCIGTVHTWDSYIFGKCCLFDEYKTRQIGFAIKLHIDTKGLGALFKDTALYFTPIFNRQQRNTHFAIPWNTLILYKHTLSCSSTHLYPNATIRKSIWGKNLPQLVRGNLIVPALNNDVFSLQAPVLGHCHKPPQMAHPTYLTNSTPVLNQTFKQWTQPMHSLCILPKCTLRTQPTFFITY